MGSRYELAKCGTEEALNRHRRRKEPVDELCANFDRTIANLRMRKVRVRRRQERIALAVATEALVHRHKEEFTRLYAEAYAEVQEQAQSEAQKEQPQSC